jgi:hypothetical protein
MWSPAILNVTGGTTYYGITGQTDKQDGWGIFGCSSAGNGGGYGVYGWSNAPVGRGVYGYAAAAAGINHGVYGESNSVSGAGVYGYASRSTGTSYGVHGKCNSPSGCAGYFEGNVNATGNISSAAGMNLDSANANSGSLSPGLTFGAGNTGEGIASQRTSSGSNQFGLDFYTGSACRMRITGGGNVQVTGTLSKGGGSFKIDHPLDPENKYLYHSFVESPDMMNIYNGTVVLDGKGEAVVTMPEWFEALNREFRYQLTAVGAPGPDLYIAEEIAGNSFKIAGGKAALKVSWQVTCVRKDPFAEKHRICVEEPKPESERGKYLHPEVYGKPREKGIGYLATPQPIEAASR